MSQERRRNMQNGNEYEKVETIRKLQIETTRNTGVHQMRLLRRYTMLLLLLLLLLWFLLLLLLLNAYGIILKVKDMAF